MHLNSVISAIRNINKLIVKVKVPNELLQASCSNLTQTRGYFSAWIGLIQADNSLKIVATSSLEESISPNIKCIKNNDYLQCLEILQGHNSIAVINKKHTNYNLHRLC